jgi:hypothetical protein
LTLPLPGVEGKRICSKVQAVERMKADAIMTGVTPIGVVGLFRYDPFYGVAVYYLFTFLRPQYMWERSLPKGTSWSFYDVVAAIVALLLACDSARSSLGRFDMEVLSASSPRSHNYTCANMIVYWHPLKRVVERGEDAFDFGRSSEDGPTMRFKKQWGASPANSEWQFYVRKGEFGAMRKESPRYQRAIRMWQRLPVAVTQMVGPMIVHGIP